MAHFQRVLKIPQEQPTNYEAEAAYLKALAHPMRLEIVDLLADEGELTAGVLQYTLDIPQTALSYHLRLLRRAGIVAMRADELRRYYQLAES